jgi:hypothetical protein
MRSRKSRTPIELPPDNAARVAIYDVMVTATVEDGLDGLLVGDLFDRVIPRLRVLVPRELHLSGEHDYVEGKVDVCVTAGILQRHRQVRNLLLLGTEIPMVRFPDGVTRSYPAGLEAAREQLEADEGKLRRGGFDVRRLVGSVADDRKSDRFQRLVASMREHGFLDFMPIVMIEPDIIVDGLARLRAAAEAEIQLKNQHKRFLSRRDTPLQLALLVLDLNADRLSDEDYTKVHDAIAVRTGRSWLEIERDLEITQEWRRVEPKEYDAKLDVKLLPFRLGQEPSVQVTTDNTRVMLRSVTEQAGLPEYSRDDLLPYIPSERARTQYSGRKAIFVSINDAIDGIERMQADRAGRKRKVDKGWDEVRQWLVKTFGTEAAPGVGDPALPTESDGKLPL